MHKVFDLLIANQKLLIIPDKNCVMFIVVFLKLVKHVCVKFVSGMFIKLGFITKKNKKK